VSHKPRLMVFVRLTKDIGANAVVDIKRMIDEAMAKEEDTGIGLEA